MGEVVDIMSDEEFAALTMRLEQTRLETIKRRNQKFYTYFPEDGPLRRELYPRHMEFFAAGFEYPERLFCAANRTGKTDAGAYEASRHLTGIYPEWWQGKRFTHPVEMWACGTNSETLRDIVQGKLLGPINDPGTGFIPSHLIADTTRRPHGLSGSIESARIRHVSGGMSLLGLKTYEQGRKSFEGTAKHVVWNDEEPPSDIYQEQLLRTLTTQGMMYTTFTPLQGMSEVVKGFFEPRAEAREIKIVIQAGWDDVPHLDDRSKRQQLATMLPYQIESRTKGTPSLGAGAIYPIPESDIKVPARSFPWTWPRGYSLDVGWNRTAALFATQDLGSGIYYIYDEHYLSVGEPSSHAAGIRARGDFMVGVIDPASRGRSQHDGVRLLDMYNDLGLTLEIADNSIHTGLLEVWTLLLEGRLKICDNCVNLLREMRNYHRDEQGNIVKVDDHLVDCLRYWVRSGRDKMKVKPMAKVRGRIEPNRGGGTSWMAN